MIVVRVLFLMMVLVQVAFAAEREVVSLGGEWDHLVTKAADGLPGDDAAWKKVQVPGATWVSPEGGSKALWYRRTIEVPASAANGRLFVDVRAARYCPQVYVDGKMIGAGSDGWSPTIVEITDAVKSGGTHQLAIRCQDRGVFFVEGFVLEKGMTDEQTRGKTLNPIGGYKDSVGIADRVLLRVTPTTYVDQEELVISTSVRKQAITVVGKVKGAQTDLSLVVEVLDGTGIVLTIPASLDESGSFNASSEFAKARYWSPEDPHLYTLRLNVRRGDELLDSYEQRFGFREIWTQGPDFYLNGVKRHLLGTSTWPVQQYEEPDVIRQKVKGILASNANTFRPHIGLWQEAWLDAADELGLMIIDEAAAYTDGSGFYAYKDERFWANYRKHIEGMIRRDRNRASLMMWSLGNEILFMGNQRYDAELPKKLGALAEHARSIDATHPLTFEADLDPDGKYDVIGLHYPFEMPQQREYPNAADWMGSRIDTEAGGGMLGQQGSRGFIWDRKKPLYIGEYLWLPHGDYSCSTIWYGDEAFLNRDRYHDLSRVDAWYDQTIAYRRSGVSGTCPWTAYEFGGVVDRSKPGFVAQREFYTPVAAFWRTRALRFFSGAESSLVFDVFNDSAKAQKLQLRVSGEGVEASKEVQLEPAGYAQVEVPVKWPAVGTDRKIGMVSELLADGKVVHRVNRNVQVWPVEAVKAPEGWELVVYDPSGKWAGSIKSLKELKQANPAKTLLLVAQNVAEPAKRDQVPVIGRAPSEVGAVREWLARGGRAVILEQGDLSVFGLDVELTERSSTMSFPLKADHPVLEGIAAEDLKYWAPDNYVTRREMVRPAGGGARAISVTGGADWLKYAPIVEAVHGKGAAVLVQMLAGERREVEPAAARLINNALAYVTRGFPAQPVQVIGDSATKSALEAMRVTQGNGGILLLSGGGAEVLAARDQIRSTLDRGGLVYWHAPTPDAFSRLRDIIGAGKLKMTGGRTGISLLDRDTSLLNGVAREDLTSTSRPGGWDRKMEFTPNAADGWLTVEREDPPVAVIIGGDQGQVPCEKAGVYEIIVDGSTGEGAIAMLVVNGVETAWTTFPGGEWRAQAMLKQGTNDIAVKWVTGGRGARVDSISVGDTPIFDQDIQLLTLPAAVARWKAGSGRVVVDTVNWVHGYGGQADGRRFANALLANLGAGFIPPKDAEPIDLIALSRLQVVGESPYMERSDDRILARAAATLEADYDVAFGGKYVISVSASGTPCAGEYPRLRVLVDGNEVGVLNTSAGDRAHKTPAVELKPGRGKLRVMFDNDASQGDEDRNVTITRVGFIKSE